MKLANNLLILTALGAFPLVVAQSVVSLHIAQVMTSTQLTETGIVSLTEAQKRALDVWLNSYTQRVLKIGASANDASNYVGVGKHSIDEVCKDGAIVSLEDDSLWEIESTDRVDTALWLAPSDVSVRKDARAVGSYNYILRNTDDHETAHAKYLGSL